MKQNYLKPNFGVGIYLPEQVLTNEDFEKNNITLKSGRKLIASQILEKIGIERRHIAGESETVADMGYLAARDALPKNKQTYLDLVIASSSHPTEYHVAREIAKRLNLKKVEALDIHAACSGSALMFSHIFDNQKKLQGKTVLLIASEKFSSTVVDLTRPDALDLDSSLGQTIFGDGAAAINFVVGKDIAIHYALNKELPEASGKTDLIYMAMGDNQFIQPCFVHPVSSLQKSSDFPDGYFVQNGPKVFEVIQNTIPGIIRDVVEKAGFSSRDIDLVVVHPGSKRLVDALREKLAPDFEVYSLYEDGNISSVSLLYSFIKALQSGRIGRGSKVVLSGFGAGSPDLYSSTVVIELL